MDLQDYDGTPMPCIKVGTVNRAKGLEFGRVYLPRIGHVRLQRRAG